VIEIGWLESWGAVAKTWTDPVNPATHVALPFWSMIAWPVFATPPLKNGAPTVQSTLGSGVMGLGKLLKLPVATNGTVLLGKLIGSALLGLMVMKPSRRPLENTTNPLHPAATNDSTAASNNEAAKARIAHLRTGEAGDCPQVFGILL